MLNQLIITIFTHFKLASSDCSGCSNNGTDDGTDCYNLGNNIYACRGTFSNGLEDNSSLSLCNTIDGYHICEDAIEAAYHGLTLSDCEDIIPYNEIYFVQETGHGGVCYSDESDASKGNKEDGLRNDIWACGAFICGNNFDCYNTLPNFCSNFDVPINGLDLGNDPDYEYDNVAITNRSRGGVVCCPPINSTNSPTGHPSDYPSVYPSGYPSGDPSIAPTNGPTGAPSAQPTRNSNVLQSTVSGAVDVVTINTTYTTSESIDMDSTLAEGLNINTNDVIVNSNNSVYSTDDDININTNINTGADGEHKMILGMINTIAGFVGIGMIAIFVILLFMKRSDGIYFFKECDSADYFAVGRYIQSCFDVWSDCLFVYAMYLNNGMDYFYLSGIFVIIPTLFSVILFIYWIFRWKTSTLLIRHRLTDYLDRYTASFIFFTIFGTFGGALSLMRSRFMLEPVFNFQLKESENERLLVWKFINDTVLEV